VRGLVILGSSGCFIHSLNSIGRLSGSGSRGVQGTTLLKCDPYMRTDWKLKRRIETNLSCGETSLISTQCRLTRAGKEKENPLHSASVVNLVFMHAYVI
jgi:hypothetical protein